MLSHVISKCRIYCLCEAGLLALIGRTVAFYFLSAAYAAVWVGLRPHPDSRVRCLVDIAVGDQCVFSNLTKCVPTVNTSQLLLLVFL